MLSEQTKARFDREIAKYPADQRQSAVMACLSIIQQEQGWVSPEAEREGEHGAGHRDDRDAAAAPGHAAGPPRRDEAPGAGG